MPDQILDVADPQHHPVVARARRIEIDAVGIAAQGRYRVGQFRLPSAIKIDDLQAPEETRPDDKFPIRVPVVGGNGFNSPKVIEIAKEAADGLVVATPCPLILAAPVALVAGVSRAARRGVVVKGAGVMERLGAARTAGI